ncbi:hypothetical protein Gohar_028385 [Gossypium harknessii]|uniref:Uncharacterized protein n=1 Tax=Gossypium harknessii TaxID=34285 RepID=A0A7J9IDQ3_9ROSI|nr:hypothetical protein [Gossypium harknessii]
MIVLVGKNMEMKLNILIVIIMGAYMGQKMMTILIFVEEEVGSPHTIQTQQVHTSVLGCCLKMVSNSNSQFVSTQCVVEGNLR